MTTTLIRRAGVLALIAATTTLTGCAGVIGAKMTYNDTEKAKITDIVLTGSSGDVAIETGPYPETQITRVVRRSSNPTEPYKLTGSTLTIDASCGMNCSVSYLIRTAPGVAVRGDLRSGDIRLDGVGATDLQVTSGDLTVTHATGPVHLRATSGDIKVLDAQKSVQVEATSGDMQVINAAGAVDLKVSSGDVNVVLTKPNSVTAQATSGDIKVVVPEGSYKLVTSAGSGDVDTHGMESDSTSPNVIDVKVGSGDVNVASGA